MLLLLLASVVSISTFTEFSMSPPLDPGTIEVPGFDPSLGELVRVELFLQMGVGGTVTFPDPAPAAPFWTLAFDGDFSGPGFSAIAYSLEVLQYETGGTFSFGYGPMATRSAGMAAPITLAPHAGFLLPAVLLSMDVVEFAEGATDLSASFAGGFVQLTYFYEADAVAEPGVELLLAAAVLLLLGRPSR
jgi:hypothetical protein